MKKLFVVLLSLMVAGALFAQVSVSFETSGDVFLARGVGSADPVSYLDSVDVDDDDYTISGSGAEGAFGAKFYYKTIDGTPAVPGSPVLGSWKAWYKYDWGTIEIGTTGDGAFNGGLPTDITDKWGTDGFSSGLVYISPAMGGLSLSAWLNASPDYVSKTITTVDTLKTSGFSVQYAVENMMTLSGTVLLGLVADTTKVNAALAFTGVENLTVKADFQYDQAEADSLAEVGAKYKMDALDVGAEFSSNWGGADLLWNVAARANYAVNTNIALRVNGAYYYDETYDFYGQGTYKFGNGFSSTCRLGMNQDDFYYRLYASYSVAL